MLYFLYHIPWGDLFVTFLLISRIGLSPGWLYMPYAIRTLKIFFLIHKIYVLPPLPGFWKIVKTHYNPKNENHCTGRFYSSNEALWCTDYNTKNPSSLWSAIPEKIKKNCTKWKLFKTWSLKKWDLTESWGFLRCNQCIKTIHLSYQISPYNDFIFWLLMGFAIFQTPGT